MKITVIERLSQDFCVLCHVNGKLLTREKTHDGFRSTYEIDGSVARFSLKSFYELETPFWFFKWFAFWLIGIFGFFTSKYERRFPEVHHGFSVNLSEGAAVKLVWPFDSYRRGRKAPVKLLVRLENCEMTDATGFVKPEPNVFEYKFENNVKMRRRNGFARKLSWLLRIAMVLLIVIIVANS
jgi:hypothetical protein